MSLFLGFLFSEKRFSRFWDLVQKYGCPFFGGSCFRKKGFPVFGTGAKVRMSLFWGFLFSEKMVHVSDDPKFTHLGYELFMVFAAAIAFFSLAHTTMSAFFAGFGFGFGFGFSTSC